VADLSSEDEKLVTLARATRARNGGAEGAAVRDDTGRTYAASTVDLPSLKLTALQAAVTMAVASGARGLEAGAVVSGAVVSEADAPADADRAALSDLNASAPLHLAGPDGAVRVTA